MTAMELYRKYVGHRAYYTGKGNIHFAVKIMDAKVSWGNEVVKITPVVGNGAKWVSIQNIKLLEEFRHEL